MILTTARGKEIVCEYYAYAKLFNVLHIYTKTLNFIEAYQLFSDSEETSKLECTYEDGQTKIFLGYTKFVGIEQNSEENGETTLTVRLTQHYSGV